MNKLQIRIAAFAVLALALVCSGCHVSGKVEQGRVIAYDRNAERVTLIPESRTANQPDPGVLPPVTVQTPSDPQEMGPAPVAGKLMMLDLKNRRLVVFDAATQGFRTFQYAPVEERRNVTKAPASPSVDRDHKTITIYSRANRTTVTIAASDEMLALPDDAWKFGDVVRYYYKDPARAVRFMNVTRTDLSSSK